MTIDIGLREILEHIKSFQFGCWGDSYITSYEVNGNPFENPWVCPDINGNRRIHVQNFRKENPELDSQITKFEKREETRKKLKPVNEQVFYGLEDPFEEEIEVIPNISDYRFTPEKEGIATISLSPDECEDILNSIIQKYEPYLNSLALELPIDYELHSHHYEFYKIIEDYITKFGIATSDEKQDSVCNDVEVITDNLITGVTAKIIATVYTKSVKKYESSIRNELRRHNIPFLGYGKGENNREIKIYDPYIVAEFLYDKKLKSSYKKEGQLKQFRSILTALKRAKKSFEKYK